MIYARIQSQRTSSARHIKYLLDGHGTNSTNAKFWTKGIRKSLTTHQNLPTAWAEIDHHWRQERDTGGTVAKKSKVTYMQALIVLPNEISEIETHSLAKQVLRLFPQKHPVTVVFHEYGASGVANKHLHMAFSYRKYGYERVDRELQQGFERNLKALLKMQYKKYGFKIEANKENNQVKYKPQNLMRVLLKKYGVDRMKNPSFLTFVVLPKLQEDVRKYEQRCLEIDSEVNVTNLQSARKSVEWLTLEISKAQSLKHPSKMKMQSHGTDLPFGKESFAALPIASTQRFGR